MDKTLVKTHEIMLKILIEVDKLCHKHNIQYWLDSGTLLGAVRHKGFIPWDDDLDISMSLDDYYKFIEVAQKELPKGMMIQTSDTDVTFPYDFAKIRDNRGIIIEQHEKNKNVKYNQGIFLDILPVIAIPSSKYYFFRYKLLFLVIKLFSYKYLNIKRIRTFLVKRHDYIRDKSNTVIIRSGKFPELSFYVKKRDIFPLQKILFENKKFFVPNNTDVYLKSLYGEKYMLLPPEDKRYAHAYLIKVDEKIYE